MARKSNRRGFFNGLSRFLLYLSGKYDRLQKSEIILGENQGLPSYRNPNFNWMQMREIRLGLEKNLDVNLYAKPNISVEQMEEIRLGLEKNLDVSFYNNSGFNWMKMREIRLGLEKKLDVSNYAKPNIKVEQMEEIRVGLEKKLDVSLYNNPEFSKRQMRELRLGLEKGLDTSFYDNSSLDWRKMKEIRLGIEQGINIHQYLGKNSYEEMKKSREGQLKKKFVENETSYIDKKPKEIAGNKSAETTDMETKTSNKSKVKENNTKETERNHIIQKKSGLTKFDVSMIFPVIGIGATDRNIKNSLIKRYKDIDQAEEQTDIYIKRIKKLIDNGYVHIDDGKYKLTEKALEESKKINREFEFSSYDSDKIFGYILRAGGALTLQDLKDELNNEYKDEAYAESQYKYIKNRIEKNVDNGYLIKNEDDTYSISKAGFKVAREFTIEKDNMVEEELEMESEI